MTDADTGLRLLEHLIADPSDVTARLVYADWLEEFGGATTEWASVVRNPEDAARWLSTGAWINEPGFGYLRALRRRAIELDPASSPYDPLTGLTVSPVQTYAAVSCGPCSFIWYNGLVADVLAPCDVFLELAPELFARHPVLEVRITDRSASRYPETYGADSTWLPAFYGFAPVPARFPDPAPTTAHRLSVGLTHVYGRSRGSARDPRVNQIPDPMFGRLADYAAVRDGRKAYQNPLSAAAALRDAALRTGRAAAGVKPPVLGVT